MVIPVMLATLTDRRDFGDDWLLERKFDGERCVARKEGMVVRLESRTGTDLTGTYPEVHAAVAAQLSRDLLLDGEVVAYDGDQTSFTRLQQRLGATAPSPGLVDRYPVVYCAFDLLEVDGEDLTVQPLVERRARLTRTIQPSSALELSEAWRDNSQRRFAAACRSGWEGLIAKRVDAPYVAGRSKDWLKLKCVWEQEFVIGGYTDPSGSRTDFGALLVGYYEHGSLRYAGKVGTGYTNAILGDLGGRLRKLETTEPAFVDARPIPRGRALDAARARRSDRIRRMDERRPPAAGALSWAPRRQESGRGRPGAASVSDGGCPHRLGAPVGVGPRLTGLAACVDSRALRSRVRLASRP